MDKPLLTLVQRAWLQEIGIDARMLSHFSAAPFAEVQAGASTSPAPAAAVAVGDAHVAGSHSRDLTVPRPMDTGVTPIAELLTRVPLAAAVAQGQRESPRHSAEQAPPMSSEAGAQNQGTLEALRDHVAACTACGLHEVRGRTVFGEGKPLAPQWMFIGEAPGEYDDSTGRPFQGRAGELLQAMLASVGISDDASVYFTNVLKCRPMGNRSPEAAEVAACLPLLRRQISLLQPACLVALGRVSAAALLDRNEELDALRGKIHAYVDEDGRSVPVVVTHHPASLLLHAQFKADAWRDLNLLPGLAP